MDTTQNIVFTSGSSGVCTCDIALGAKRWNGILSEHCEKTTSPFALGASYKLCSSRTINFIYNAYGFYKCPMCKGYIRSKCNICCNELQVINKYNFDTANVICYDCSASNRLGDICHLNISLDFSIPQPITKTVNGRKVILPAPREIEMKEIEYRGKTFNIPFYRNDCNSKLCIYCCNNFSDITHESEIIKSYKLERYACYKCIIDFMYNCGIFRIIKSDLEIDEIL